MHAPVGQEPFSAGNDRMPVDDALNAEPFLALERLDCRERPDFLACRGGDGAGDRMLGGRFERADEPENLTRARARRRDDLDQTSSCRS